MCLTHGSHSNASGFSSMPNNVPRVHDIGRQEKAHNAPDPRTTKRKAVPTPLPREAHPGTKTEVTNWLHPTLRQEFLLPEACQRRSASNTAVSQEHEDPCRSYRLT